MPSEVAPKPTSISHGFSSDAIDVYPGWDEPARIFERDAIRSGRQASKGVGAVLRRLSRRSRDPFILVGGGFGPDLDVRERAPAICDQPCDGAGRLQCGVDARLHAAGPYVHPTRGLEMPLAGPVLVRQLPDAPEGDLVRAVEAGGETSDLIGPGRVRGRRSRAHQLAAAGVLEERLHEDSRYC